jgi:photosystem II oxygen-evolving enhancer protein 1
VEPVRRRSSPRNTAALTGTITFNVAKSDTQTGHLRDTDLGSKAPKEVKIVGIFYAQVE